LTSCEWWASDGLVPYAEALSLMEERTEAILAGQAGELVWLLEHEPVYTAGTSAQEADLLRAGGLPVFQTGRGGKHTYHGPGQRVAYVLHNLAQRDRDLKAHVARLEEWGIRALADLGVRAERRTGRIGLWVQTGGTEKKIAAIGVRARRWVTSHGIAINVAPDLEAFMGIVPCGIADYGVTSLADLGIGASLADMDAALRRHYEDVF